MKILILFITVFNFFSTARASQLSCEDVVRFDAMQEFGTLAGGPSLKNKLTKVAQSADTVLFEAVLVSYDVNGTAQQQEEVVYITARKVGNTCTDVKYLFP